MRMLSVDPNTKDTGLVMWEDGKPTGAHSINQTRADRLLMVQRIIECAGDYRAEMLAVEDVYMGVNARTALTLAKLVGGIEAAALYAGFDVLMLSTGEIDAACGIPAAIDRKERKARLAALARLELGDGLMQDTADAYAVGVAALGRLKVMSYEGAQ